MLKALAILFVLLHCPLKALERVSVAETAEHIAPILNGQFVPDVQLKTDLGEPIGLLDIVENKPSVVLFYRGGWCPYCSRQMAGLMEVEQRIVDLGYQIVAISPDSPEKLRESQTHREFNVTRLSDENLSAAIAFGIAYFLPDNTANFYRRNNGADLKTPQGDDRPVLPVPAAFVTDTSGLVKFQYVNPNYKVRVEPQLLYYAARIAK